MPRYLTNFMKKIAALFACPFGILLLSLVTVRPGYTQTETGELRIQVHDTQNLGVSCTVSLVSEANQVNEIVRSNPSGLINVRRLPFGNYVLTIQHKGFNPLIKTVKIQSALPVQYSITLRPARAETSIRVNGTQTLIDTDRAGAMNEIGKRQIQNRQMSLPGRGLTDLVNSQPGWLYEGNAVLHPRGSEYQTQFVVNGIPLTENRSPGLGPQLEASDVQSMSIYTAGIPAEYGRKMGGVIEVNTLRDARPGMHGTAVLSGGSFSTADGYLFTQYGWGKNSAGIGANGAYTDWYENPPVLQNYTNNATNGDFSGQYEREFSPKDRLSLVARHEFARFLVPNEQIQEATGQVQHRDVLETMGTAAWQHIVSSHMLTDLSGMVRDDTTHLTSNAESTPIIAGQDRGYREGYLKGSGTADHGAQEWKAGFETDFIDLHEQFNYTITDPTQFDPGTPTTFNFLEYGRDREQAIFVEDNVHIHNWNLAAGMRWDNYELVVHRNAFSPRLALSRYFPRKDLVAHISYDRVFQTPAFENILLSSSAEIVSLDPNVLRLPVEPSQGNYYEAGITKGIFHTLRLDVNSYIRRFNNFADDNPLLDTAISFPISFRRASIYGAEGKIDLPNWRHASGFLSYSYMVASVYLPVTGGLFLGDDATQALQQTSGRLWVSQDQRNTVRTRWIYQLPHGLWMGTGAQYDSGLPVEFTGTEQQAIAQYGAGLVDRVNFSRGRIKPSLAVDASAGVHIMSRHSTAVSIQVDGENLNNRINLIDFAGLFSGNAVAPPRSYGVRMTFEF